MKNIRKFNSTEDYTNFRKTDGWDYPNVSFVEGPIESQVHYNNEFIMRWNDNDVIKTPSFYGDVSLDTFKNWVDGASKPCEIKKDGTDFAYLKMDGNNVADFTKRDDNSASHYSTNDKEDYMQMTEIKNINVGLFQDSAAGTKEVRFNFDEGCPAGFHKWFPNSTTGTKLWGRYNVTSVGNVTDTATSGISVGYGLRQGTDGAYDASSAKGNWSANYIRKGIDYLNSNLDSTASGYQYMEMTYWEHLVLTYIFSAYFGTFNSQSVYWGLSSNYTGAGSTGGANQWLNGNTDTILTHYGSLAASGTEATANAGYKFMHMENPLHGNQWIWAAGFRGELTKYYMTFDDIKANTFASTSSADMIIANADVTGTIPSMSSSYISKIDVYGVPTAAGDDATIQASDRGFFDCGWSNVTVGSRVAYLGGDSYYGAGCGAFARGFFSVASGQNWGWRGRVTMNR